MLYPADNYPHLSKSIHSIGVDQRVTTSPTFGNKPMVASAKYFASKGLQGLGDLSAEWYMQTAGIPDALIWMALGVVAVKLIQGKKVL